MKARRLTIVLTAGYLLCQILADITAVKLAGPIFGQFVPAAVFIYAVTFTWRDLVHRHLGKETAIALVWTAGVANVLMAAYLLLTVSLPPAPFWPNQDAYATILGIVPRIVVASIIAELVSQLIDTQIYHSLLRRRPWVGVVASNAVALVVDSIIFCGLAFIGTMPLFSVGVIAWGQVLVKAAITVLSLPLIYIVRRQDGETDADVGQD